MVGRRDSGGGGGFLSRLTSLDAFPKTREDYRVRTTSGGTISLVALVVMCTLFVYEFSVFLPRHGHTHGGGGHPGQDEDQH